MDNGQWTMDNGQWTTDNGQWTTDNGWIMVNGMLHFIEIPQIRNSMLFGKKWYPMNHESILSNQVLEYVLI
ncbi:hypothetical protein BOTNAR_0110g00240 [Botryotinia narcissicola]|uniref:Uncharacterized protein n=1 Tax=Botryotinia narcissicola TaxID=278944 RepID=A0A4Z1IT67_9HELO|nr:hypothetical protein BOTNAR_0110g00240 [Botryotinia narcissicola]